MYNFRAADWPEVALKEVLDDLESIVDGLLHLEGEGVAVVPGYDEEGTLGEVKEEREVVSNNHPALQLSYITEAVTIDSS